MRWPFSARRRIVARLTPNLSLAAKTASGALSRHGEERGHGDTIVGRYVTLQYKYVP